MNISRFWKSSFGFSFFTLISRIFGYLRDLVLSSSLGASNIHDIFVVVFRIPNVFRSFFGEGAMSQSLVPSILEAKKNQKKFLNQVFSLLFTVLSLFVIIVLCFPSLFVALFAPGFLSEGNKFDNSSYFLRLVFPYILLISVVAFLGAIQNSNKQFQAVAATPIIFNITLIIFALSVSELSLTVIGISILVAGLMQLILNLWVTFKLNYFPSLDFNFDFSLLSSFFNRLLPAIFAAGIYQINILVDTIFASFLPAGSPTWLYLSERIIQLPLGMFGVAVAVVSLPNISEFFQKKNYDALRANIFQGFSTVILVGFASLVGLFLLSELIVFLLFERGQFTSFDTIQTSKSLLAYAFGLPFLMSNKFFNTIYFAMSKTSMVLKLGLVSLFINILLNYFFVYVLELNHVGIALATSFSAIAIYLISLFWLNKNNLFNGRGKILSYIFAILGLLIMIFTINT